ncbi:MAG: NADH-quinone oxidoreductase subunit M [Planctomyces sp.]|nr:NADH-quinone oxidoreductase subunit M [Planctomyces sp.]
MIPLLFLSLAAPFITALLLMLFRSSLNQQSARLLALGGSLATLVLAAILSSQYYSGAVRPLESSGTPLTSSADETSAIRPKVEFRQPWLSLGGDAEHPEVKFEMYFGLDGISVAMIALTALLTVSSVLISWESISDRASEFYASVMILEAGLIGVFCAFDIILFYVFFEMTLIPLFFMIAIWGGPDRRRAAIKFFLYTLAGSLITLSGLIGLMVYTSGEGLATPSSLPALSSWIAAHPIEKSLQVTLFLAMSAGFLVKVPVFPFHTWLPLAHVEAPTAGSVLLAGVLLKLGSYGFLRMCLPMFPEACVDIGLPVIGLLSVIGIIYGSLCALAQRDIKKLVAYSSVAHLGFCMVGLFALNTEGLTGSVLQMINHGLSTGALFLIVGMVYERYHTRMLDDIGGLAQRLPLIAVCMVFIAMSSIGLPGLNGFVGEFLSLAGMFRQDPLYAALATTGVVLGAWYLLTAVQHAFFGKLREPHGHHGDHDTITDLKPREFVALAPLVILCLWIGIRPATLIDLIEPDVKAVADIYTKTTDAGAQ